VDKDTEAKQEEATERQQSELKEKLSDINKRLLTLEWDKKHNQLNAGMEEKYTELKAEHDKLLAQINGN